MQIGDVVKIYQRPLTEEDYEGEAKLVRCLNPDGGYWEGRCIQQWMVAFTGAEERPVCRSVLVCRTLLCLPDEQAKDLSKVELSQVGLIDEMDKVLDEQVQAENEKWAAIIAVRIVDEMGMDRVSPMTREDGCLLRQVLRELFILHPDKMRQLIGTSIIEEGYFEDTEG